MYNEKIMQLFTNPKNVGHIVKADAVGKMESGMYGEVIEISVRMEGDKIVDAKFQTYGNAVAIAVSSVATQLIIGKTLIQCQDIDDQEYIDRLGEIPEKRMYCLDMMKEALAHLNENYYERQERLAKKLGAEIEENPETPAETPKADEQSKPAIADEDDDFAIDYI